MWARGKVVVRMEDNRRKLGHWLPRFGQNKWLNLYAMQCNPAGFLGQYLATPRQSLIGSGNKPQLSMS